MNQDLQILDQTDTTETNENDSVQAEVEENLDSLSGALIEMQFGFILPADC